MTLDDIQRRDATDPLAGFRSEFTLPEGVIYLDGNSLGALPRATAARLADTVTREWGQDLIRSWNTADWIGAPQRVGGKIAQLVGARTDEVVVADSTSVNLFKLLAAGLKARPGRTVILTEPGNFPTDLYVAQGVQALLPEVTVRTAPRETLLEAIDADVAVVMLTHVHYKSGARFDMAAVTAAAHARGALVLWDLSHSVGAVEIDLNGADADLAVGCGYKYLNGGPGAPAFLFAARALQADLASPLTGWMGHAAPFAFGDDYAPAPGLDRFLCGTPPILGVAALEVGVEIALRADMAQVAEKSRQLSALFIDRVEDRCAGLGLTLASPRAPEQRGSHIAFTHEAAYPVMQALIARGVIGDFRAPDILRFGFTPLYLRHADVWNAVEILREVLVREAWREPAYQVRAAVT
ncbi:MULTISPECIES: kynureninase [unclassified Caulobacter]|uniref:kynureninase n=1 Tax=unclassified Caulobacter TaxID=2648921 RepID=UPI000D362771|nr:MULTISPECIES: kynureninase [unclassified Caulobacter]PTS88679.1 kynureninase [Caulobacter sp. HMWF009]PTT05188.1 kynureninase [Caulobacter sp. HMWF025]